MEIIINGQQLEFSLENEKTVGDILHAIEQDCAKNNATIIRITIDGNLASENEFEKVFETSLDTIKVIQLETMSENDVVRLLQEVAHAVGNTIEQLQKIPVLLQSSKDNEVSAIVVTFVDQFNAMRDLVRFCGLFPQKFENFLIENQSFTAFFQDFIPILQEFESSLVSHDTVLTGDLAEYEIVPKLKAFVDASTTLYGMPC